MKNLILLFTLLFTLPSIAQTINLFDELTLSPDTGGSWSQTFDCDSIAISNPQSVTITGGDLGTVDFTGTAIGIYTFSYWVFAPNGACADCQEVTVTRVAGVASTADACIGDIVTPFNDLGSPPTPGTGGSWVVDSQPVGGTIVAPAPYNGTVDFTGQPEGSYILTYTDLTSACFTVTYDVDPVPNAGGPGSITLCN